MFDPTSRYASLEVATHHVTDARGERREVRYVRRRFLPPLDEQVPLVEHLLTEGERLDHLAARYLNDPAQSWRLCDANGVLHPDELEERVGRMVRVATTFR
ncbi:LysM domain-containing protein [Myxococcus sp. RHSTA-1-4]|uniref:LysM domain-containing protein n=1 Tax=Myxococcus sp. RHSTA-1-4 TaxID=2874601 RepID=UPI001CBCDE96|nr:LysM domain-containing protein [Myxococcus sp. RHSTA-1-4]MBZ4415592.1 LysM domain-containing protein [Myxococcus sp. RHSTA-1-4]